MKKQETLLNVGCGYAPQGSVGERNSGDRKAMSEGGRLRIV